VLKTKDPLDVDPFPSAALKPDGDPSGAGGGTIRK
jgi:hypothetical protein